MELEFWAQNTTRVGVATTLYCQNIWDLGPGVGSGGPFRGGGGGTILIEMRILSLFGLLLGSALSAVAGTVALVAPAGGAASASVTVAPIVSYGRMKGGDIQSALSFLNRPALQEWLWTSRPAQAEATLVHARRLADFGELARVYGKAPNDMRWAILMRGDKEFQKPGTAGTLLGINGFLAGSYDAARAAYCAWESLEQAERDALGSRGQDAASWARHPLPERVRRLREVWIASLRAQIPDSPLDPRYAPVIRAFLTRAGGYLNDDEAATMRRDAERSERLIERAAEMKEKAVRAGDMATLEGLNRVAATGDMDSARAEFDRVYEGSGGDARRTEVPQELPPEALSFVAGELEHFVRAFAAGTPAAAVLDGALEYGPLKVAFERTTARSIAHYEPWLDRLVFDPDDLSEFLRSEGRAAQDLISDRSLLARYALALGPVFVHEATHARQHRLLARRGLKGHENFYQQAMEIEAFAVQGSFARGVVARLPSAGSLIAGFKANPSLHRLTVGWDLPDELVSGVRRTYRRVPGSHRAWLTSFRGLVGDRRNLKPYERPVISELARRRRLSAVERLRLEREGAEGDAPVEGLKTSALRRLVAWVSGGSRMAVEAVSAANEELMANAKASLEAYHQLAKTSAQR